MGGREGVRRVSVRTNHCATVRRHWARWASLHSAALRGGGRWHRSLEEEVEQRHVRQREERPAQEPRICARRCRRPEQRGPWGAAGCFPRNTAGAVVGPSTSWMSSCFSFPSSSS